MIQTEYELGNTTRGRITHQDVTDAILYGYIRYELKQQLKSTLQSFGVIRDLVGIVLGYIQELTPKEQSSATKEAIERVKAPSTKPRYGHYW
jgi:hypothetical protein